MGPSDVTTVRSLLEWLLFCVYQHGKQTQTPSGSEGERVLTCDSVEIAQQRALTPSRFLERHHPAEDIMVVFLGRKTQLEENTRMPTHSK